MSRSKQAKQRRNRMKNAKRKAHKNDPLQGMVLRRDIVVCVHLDFIHEDDRILFPHLRYFEAQNGVEGVWQLDCPELEACLDDNDFLGAWSTTYIGSDIVASLARDYVATLSFENIKLFF